MHDITSVAASPNVPALPKPIVFLLAFACGATTANVYYAQSIAGLIADSIGISHEFAGLIVTLTQLGYGLGLFFLVSLADLVENRQLVLLMTGGTVVSLLWVASSSTAPSLLAGSFVLGACAVGSQVLVPLTVHLSPSHHRGRVIGALMGGLVAGIMLSRPLSSFLAAHYSWRAIFVLSAAIMLAVLGLLAWNLPVWRPRRVHSYLGTLRSTLTLLATVRSLQRRAAYQGALFAAFNLFWTSMPLMLRDQFDLGQLGIAAFALVGAAGAVAAPFAGIFADRRGVSLGTGAALLSAVAAFAGTGWAQAASSIGGLVAAAVVLDGAVQANQVFGQRVVQSIDPAARGRLNAAYMTVIFLCGAIGSSLGSVTYAHGGWPWTATIGAAIAAAMFPVFFSERRRRSLDGTQHDYLTESSVNLAAHSKEPANK